MFEQTFKNLDDVLWKEAGCGSELDYAEQTSWLLFLKYLEDTEPAREMNDTFAGRTYAPLFEKPYRWSTWVHARKDELTGDDLIKFVNHELFPYLQGFKQPEGDPNTIEYKIGEIFSEVRNKFSSGYLMRDAVDLIDGLEFKSQEQKHELSDLYETRIKNMGNAGRNGGEYYTPRPLIRAMIRVTDPQIGETIFDPACGSAGFLCESFQYLWEKNRQHMSPQQLDFLQSKTFHGREKKSLAYILGVMNMILHGIEAPNIVHGNTLAEKPLDDIQPHEQHHIILANPPFGGKERKEVQQNFSIKTGETAFLFLQYFIKSLKPGGRAAVIIKNTFLSNSDNASRSLRKRLLEDSDLHTILDCPAKTFLGAGVKTVVLFFTKGAPTRKLWYYQLDPGRSLGKTSPLNDDDLAEFVEFQKTKADSERSWSIDVKTLDKDSADLSVKNPNAPEAEPLRDPAEILDEIAALEQETAEALNDIRALIA